jgi:hypothetical protein
MESAACWLAAMVHSLIQARDWVPCFYIERSVLAKLGTRAKKGPRRKLRTPDLTEISFRIKFLTLEAVATPSGLGRKQCFHRPQI